MPIRTLYEHPFFRLEALSRGEATLVRMRSNDWVNVLPLTTDGRAVLIRQHRFGVDAVTLEIPGGVVDAGEEPFAAARRELREETGYGGGTWRSLGVAHPNPAIQTNRVHMYVADGVVLEGPQHLDALEDITVELVPIDRVARLADEGTISHALAQLTVLRWLRGDATTG
jgi:8-oxo-dGTP pyrophosphatase MutT (NUDIX family)